MAQTRSTLSIPGFTRRVGQAYSYPTFTSSALPPAGMIFQDTGGFDYYLWPDTSGRLRITDAATAEAGGFNWNSGGTIVGTQS